jgi:hypothetical protein
MRILYAVVPEPSGSFGSFIVADSLARKPATEDGPWAGGVFGRRASGELIQRSFTGQAASRL